MSSLGNSVLSELEVVSLLLAPDGLEGLLVLGEAESAGLGALVSKVLGGVLLALPGVLGGSSSLLVDHGQDLGNALSNNLNKNTNGVSHTQQSRGKHLSPLARYRVREFLHRFCKRVAERMVDQPH